MSFKRAYQRATAIRVAIPNLRDWMAWVLVCAARRLTTLGDADDMLKRVEKLQRWAAFDQKQRSRA